MEPERCYTLAKARGIHDGIHVIRKCPAASLAGTPEEAKRKRVEASPAYLRGRVEEEAELPEVEVMGHGEGDRDSERDRKRGRSSSEGQDEAGEFKQEELSAVALHVVAQLKAELVLDLMEALRPRWSCRRVRREGEAEG